MHEGRYKDKAKGIMDGLEETEEGTQETREEKNKRVNDEKSKSVQEEKKKRSFMLTISQVEKLYLLKAKNNDKTLSAMVGEAIEEYYKNHTD